MLHWNLTRTGGFLRRVCSIFECLDIQGTSVYLVSPKYFCRVCTEFYSGELLGQVQTMAHNHIMVTHSCVDHAWSFLTWLSRMSVLTLHYHLFIKISIPFTGIVLFKKQNKNCESCCHSSLPHLFHTDRGWENAQANDVSKTVVKVKSVKQSCCLHVTTDCSF